MSPTHPHDERFTPRSGTDDPHATELTPKEDKDRGVLRGDFFGTMGVVFAVLGWGSILLGIPLSVVLDSWGLFVVVGSCICLVSIVFSSHSNDPARKVILLCYQGAGAIPAALILLAYILTNLFWG